MKLSIVFTVIACGASAWRWSQYQDDYFDKRVNDLLTMIRQSIDNKGPGLVQALEKAGSSGLEEKTALLSFNQAVEEATKRRLDYFADYITDIHHNRISNLPKDFFTGYTSFLKTKYNIVEPPRKPRDQYRWRQGQIDFFYKTLDELIFMVKESVLGKVDNLVPILEKCKSTTEERANIEAFNQSTLTAVANRLEHFAHFVKEIHHDRYRDLPSFVKSYAAFVAKKGDKEAKKKEILARVEDDKREATRQAAQELRALEGGNRANPRPAPKERTDVFRVLRQVETEDARRRDRDQRVREVRHRGNRTEPSRFEDFEEYDDDYSDDDDYYYEDRERERGRGRGDVEVVYVRRDGRGRHGQGSPRRAGLDPRD